MARDKITLEVDPRTGVASFANIEFFSGTMADVLKSIERLVGRSETSLIVTPNVDHIVLAENCHLFMKALQRSDIALADGMPLVALCRILGASLNRLTGADLLPAVLAVSKDKSWRIALVGNSDASRRAAVAKSRELFPGITIQGFDIPFLSSYDDPAGKDIIVELKQWRPSIVFMGLGAPKQELWFLAHESSLPNAVYIGSGAAVDFWSGSTARAPRIWQSMSLEWFWRLLHEPKRLAKRYLTQDVKFLFVTIRSIRLAWQSKRIRHCSNNNI